MRLPSGFWRKCRIGFRWFRISVLLLVLAFVCAVLWFNRIGLPDFLKKPFVEKLHARGIELEFTRLRLNFLRGLVAENVRLGGAKIPDHPSLSIREIQLHLNFHALLHGRLEVTGLTLNQGELLWPVSPTNALSLQNIQTGLRFEKNDRWLLDNFHAEFAGAKFALSGDIAHATELRHWKFFHLKKTGAPMAMQKQLQKISDALNRIHFAGTPQISLVLNGDARDLHSFDVRLNVNASGAQTPWFSGRDIQLAAILTVPAGAPTHFDASWDFWTNAQPFQLVWSARLAQLQSEKMNADSVACAGFWRAPEFVVTNLSAKMGGGKFNAAAKLNVATREFIFTNSSDCDLHAFAALLTKNPRGRLEDFSWTQPPWLQIGGSLILPAWTNRQPDWNGVVRKTIRLNGELAFTNGTIRRVTIDLVHTHFSYSNLTWQLPDLAIALAETKLRLEGGENDGTKIYWARVHGAFDPETIRPYLTKTNEIRGLNHFTFTEPLALDVNVRGRLYDYASIGATGYVALTNFTIRAQPMDSVAGELFYTNRVLNFFHPRMWRENGAQTMTADKITLNFDEGRIYFTNGFSTADPLAVARAIGPKIGRLLEPYHFLQPPTAYVNGCSPMRDVNNIHDVDDADLRFDIPNGAPFQWLKLRTPSIAGTIHWLGETLILTNVTAAFYGGSGNGFANFDFRAPHEGADYQFAVNVTNANLHALAVSLTTPTNHLDGTFAGRLIVTNADTRDWRTWNGYGHASLRDGLLWDIPIFSILSPILNAFWPGLGNSRATDAEANFAITNGVFFSDTLEIRSTLMRLEYAGTVDLKQNVNARVTAQLLRDAWVIGPLVSTVFSPVSKLFEYKVTGTLKAPKMEPVYVPKLLLMPLHPIRSLEKIFPGSTSTNAPPEN